MRVDFDGSVITRTELAYSYANSRTDGSTLYLPSYNGCLGIPGRLFRGRIRHLNFMAITHRLGKGNLSLADWRFNLLGGVLQEGGRAYNVLLHRHKFEKHPFVGLWGCMEPVAYWGKVQIEIALASNDIKPIIMAGQRTDPVQKGEVKREDVSDPSEFDAYVAALSVDRTEREERQKREAQRAVEARKNGRKAAAGEEPEPPRKITNNMPFARQMIPRGISFEHHMSLTRDTTEVQLGQFLIALEEFAEDPYIGAHTGVNGGIVDLQYRVRIDKKEVGEIKVDGRERTIDMNPELKKYSELFWNRFSKMDFSIPTWE